MIRRFLTGWFLFLVLWAKVATAADFPNQYLELLDYSRNLSLEDAWETLTAEAYLTRGYHAVEGRSLSGGSPCRIHFLSVIGDPRVERIRQLLSEMDREVAFQQSRQIYLRQLKKYQDGNSMREDQIHVLTSLLFLCSEYSSVEQFDALFLKWSLWHREKFEREPGGWLPIRMMPDALVTASLYANVIDRHCGQQASIQAVTQACQKVGIGQFAEAERMSTELLFEPSMGVERQYLLLRWGDNEGLVLKNDGGEKSAALDHQLRCQAIPQLDPADRSLETAKRWLAERETEWDKCM